MCQNSAFFNNITYVAPRVPTLYTLLSAAGDLATDPRIYGSHTNTFVFEKDQIVDIVVNNLDPGKHPFHLHGHNFQVVSRSAAEAGEFDPEAVEAAEVPGPGRERAPMRRDTIVLLPNGNLVLRFRADNPGV